MGRLLFLNLHVTRLNPQATRKPPSARLSSYVALHSLFVVLSCISNNFPVVPYSLAANAEHTGRARYFDLQAGAASGALPDFSEQAGVQVLFPTDRLDGIRTNAVRGEMTPVQALEKMLAGTPLVVVYDETTGAFGIKRATDASVAARSSGSGPNRALPQSQFGSDSHTSTNPNMKPKKTVGWLVRLFALVTAIDPLAAQSTTNAPPKTTEEPIVKLSPFEVVANNRGYYGANTMSGTRLNSSIADLASSITVVTKEQMQDFALLDINDIFNYESGTEGTGNFSDITFDRRGTPIDNVQFDPNNANRIRGIGPANITFGNFETTGRVPIDPIDIDAVEISRGPNSTIFGLGNASGTVNSQFATANFDRNRSQVGARADSYGGYRATLDLNRVLKKSVLAIRGSAVTQHDAYVRKPSGTNTMRLNGMVKYRPFEATTLTAYYSRYVLDGNRPNAATPRDAIGYWKSQGSPTWDPVTQQVKIGGQVVATNPTNAGLPSYLYYAFNDRPSLFIDQGGAQFWTVNQTSRDATPGYNFASAPFQSVRYMWTAPDPIRLNQPLFATWPAVSDKAVYDWSRINLSAPNWVENKTTTSIVQLEHLFFNTGRQTLSGQVAWFREDSEQDSRTLVGIPTGQGATGFLQVDINERRLDGSPNPFFLRPFIGEAEQLSYRQNPIVRDIYRGQLAYELDLRREKNLLRWMGMHRAVGYYEYKKTQRMNFGYRDAMVDRHAWLPASLLPGSTQTDNASTTYTTRPYARYFVGDNQGQNVDYAPSSFAYGNYTFNWRNGVTGQWVEEPAVLGRAASVGGSGFGSLTVLKTQGVALQSYLLQDRIITTFGVRKDRIYGKSGVGPKFLPDRLNFDYDAMDAYTAGDWSLGEGTTRTAGVVVKPFRSGWLRLHANKSDSFRPEGPAINVFGERLPDPRGKGEDYGFSLDLLSGKLVVRVNRYLNRMVNTRAGVSGGLVFRMLDIDFPMYGDEGPGSDPKAYKLSYRAREWILADAKARGITLTPAQLFTQTAAAMGVSEERLAYFTNPDGGEIEEKPGYIETSEVDNQLAKGTEVEFNYNPNAFWTMKLNVTEQISIDSALSPNLVKYIDERLPFWKGIIDPTTGRSWYTERRNGDAWNTSAEYYFDTYVVAPLKLARATEGKSRPQVRKYRANFSANYRLAGLTEHRVLKRFNVGGALRWEDKGAIGFYGVEQYPAKITDYDGSRPIWDKAHLYVDLLVGYRTRLFKDKVGATFQINARNVGEGGRLQPVFAYPNGMAHTYRIIDPRQFIFSASFDM